MSEPKVDVEKLLEQRAELMRYLGVLVDRAGGEVRIGLEDLAPDRFLKKDTIGIAGVVILKAERAR